MDKCSYCLFQDTCNEFDEECDAFAPIEEDNIDEVIEAGRQEFLSEWIEYISESLYFFN